MGLSLFTNKKQTIYPDHLSIHEYKISTKIRKFTPPHSTQQNPIINMKYKTGTIVKIKTGVKVKDLKFSVEGWHGRIGTSAYPDSDMIMIELDSVVMKSLPEDYIIKTLQGTDIDWFNHFYLNEDDVEPATARDTSAEVEATLEHINDKYYWKAMSDGSPEDELLAEIMSELEDEDWFGYLEEHLTFPFEVEVVESERLHDPNLGKKFKVYSFEIDDDLYGIIVNGRKMRKKVNYPLCDLEVTDKESPNYLSVRAYSIWFANR